jgi:hypothetical protein
MRRSQRLIDKVEVITISDSEDEDVDAPLPRQQSAYDSSYDSDPVTPRHPFDKETVAKETGKQIDAKLESAKQRATKRRLVLDKIVGAVKDESNIDFLVQWKGLEQSERVPLRDMRILFPKEILDYMYEKIKFKEKVGSQNASQQI